mmetsp:Transcript_104087/g.321063  ORF Transcript_104087/g.321063 Transcript_104087/m.321063 type:complete len:304 (+) Transcript_104087:1688-2599(+)
MRFPRTTRRRCSGGRCSRAWRRAAGPARRRGRRPQARRGGQGRPTDRCPWGLCSGRRGRGRPTGRRPLGLRSRSASRERPVLQAPGRRGRPGRAAARTRRRRPSASAPRPTPSPRRRPRRAAREAQRPDRQRAPPVTATHRTTTSWRALRSAPPTSTARSCPALEIAGTTRGPGARRLAGGATRRPLAMTHPSTTTLPTCGAAAAARTTRGSRPGVGRTAALAATGRRAQARRRRSSASPAAARTSRVLLVGPRRHPDHEHVQLRQAELLHGQEGCRRGPSRRLPAHRLLQRSREHLRARRAS